MNWKQYSQLFANNKFKAVLDDNVWLIRGILDECFDLEIKETGFGIEYIQRSVPSNLCRLIARPISDMSDEEIASWEKVKHPTEYDYGNDSALIESPKSFMYLIAIGVLPPIFDDTDVIWRYEND